MPTRRTSGDLSIVIYKYDGSRLELASQDRALCYLDIRDSLTLAFGAGGHHVHQSCTASGHRAGRKAPIDSLRVLRDRAIHAKWINDASGHCADTRGLTSLRPAPRRVDLERGRPGAGVPESGCYIHGVCGPGCLVRQFILMPGTELVKVAPGRQIGSPAGYTDFHRASRRGS